MPPYGYSGAPSKYRNERGNGNGVSSPVTPAVTGIDYPSNEDVSVEADLYRNYSQPNRSGQSHSRTQSQSYSLSQSRSHSRSHSKGGLYTHPNIAGSTLDDAEPPADSHARALNDVWERIRLEKEKKMAKERPKVQSLEEMAQELVINNSSFNSNLNRIPVMEASSPPPHHHSMSPPIGSGHTGKSVRKPKSMCAITLGATKNGQLTPLSILLYRSNFRESTDGRAMVATFDLPDVDKQDIHISFQRNRLVLTWEIGEITEWEEEDGVILREHTRKMYHRTLPLPEGTRVRVHGLLREMTLMATCYFVVRRDSGADDEQRTHFAIPQHALLQSRWSLTIW